MNIFLCFMYHSFEGSVSLGTREGNSFKSNRGDVYVVSFLFQTTHEIIRATQLH